MQLRHVVDLFVVARDVDRQMGSIEKSRMSHLRRLDDAVLNVLAIIFAADRFNHETENNVARI